MDGHHPPFIPTGHSHYTGIWITGVRYLILKYANLPETVAVEQRRTMQAGIRRVLDVMLTELETVEVDATNRLILTMHGLAVVLDDANQQ